MWETCNQFYTNMSTTNILNRGLVQVSLNPSSPYSIIQCALDISRSFSAYNSRKSLHSSPVRARCGVSFVNANLTEVLSLKLLYSVHYCIIYNRDISRVHSIISISIRQRWLTCLHISKYSLKKSLAQCRYSDGLLKNRTSHEFFIQFCIYTFCGQSGL